MVSLYKHLIYFPLQSFYCGERYKLWNIELSWVELLIYPAISGKIWENYTTLCNWRRSMRNCYYKLIAIKSALEQNYFETNVVRKIKLNSN